MRMSMSLTSAAGLWSGVVLGALPGLAQVSVIEVPNALNGTFFSPRTLSGDGNTVVGLIIDSASHAQLWEVQSRTFVGLPAGTVAGERHNGASASYDGSVIFGVCSGPAGQTGFRWRRGVDVVLLDGQPGQPRIMSVAAASADGRFVTGNIPGPAANRGAVWSAEFGTRVIPGIPGGPSSLFAVDVSDDGQTVLGVPPGTGTPFLWREATGSFAVPTPPGTTSAYSLTLTGLGDAVFGMAGDQPSAGGVPFTWNAESGTTAFEGVPGYVLTLKAASSDGRVVAGYVAPPLSPNVRRAVVHTFGAGTETLAAYLRRFGADFRDEDFQDVLDVSEDGLTILGQYGIHPIWIVRIPPLGPADFNADSFTDFLDLADYLDCFEGLGPLPVSSADLNRDGITDFFDLIEFLDHF